MTRTELVAKLQVLEVDLEQRIDDNPHTVDPWPEFSVAANAIQHAAGPNDEDYVGKRITCILAKHGLIPADDAYAQWTRFDPPIPRRVTRAIGAFK